MKGRAGGDGDVTRGGVVVGFVVMFGVVEMGVERLLEKDLGSVVRGLDASFSSISLAKPQAWWRDVGL